jgi:stage II sporulation protein D
VRRLSLLAVLSALSAPAAETMRIAVGMERSAVAVSGEGLRQGPDQDEAELTPAASPALQVTREQGRLLVGGHPVEGPAVRFRAQGALTVDGTRVDGDVVVLPGKTGLQAVNVLPLEAYLEGVLGSEMPPSYPMEALKAQAVAARTYALSRKLEQYDQPFHLGSSVLSQVYKGLAAVDPRTHQAVQATRGQVLTWMLQPIEAYFHASCGGHTESGLDALGRDLPYLQSVDCPCGQLPQSAWSLTLGPGELAALGAVKGATLKVQGRSPTGRARSVALGPRTVDAVWLRERLGYSRLKSLTFDISRARQGWRLDGHGFGHGAGLCQWGARVYAEKGWDFRRILLHYYPGTELQTLYE